MNLLKSRSLLVWALWLNIVLICSPVQGQFLSEKIKETGVMNINEWTMFYHKAYLSLWNSSGKMISGAFPVKDAVLIYSDGLIWGGYVRDGREPSLRVSGTFDRSGVQPGWIIQEGRPGKWPEILPSDDERARIYRWRKDFFEITDQQLRAEVALLLNLPEDSVTSAQIDTLKQQYLKDLLEWPAEHGAPYYDRNQNGRYDPEYDEPGILGADQLLWYVVNDVNESKAWALFGALPTGMEVQVTAWAYKIGLSSVVFRRYRLINKSGARIDSIFVGQFVENDIGDYSDDLVGCDSSLSYGFAYNGYENDEVFNRFGMSPPALGVVLLQGPVVYSPGSVAVQNFKQMSNYRNLPMTSFYYLASGDAFGPPNMGVYDGTLSAYANLQGYAEFSWGEYLPFKKYFNGEWVITSPWPLSGNPITGEGDIDGRGGNVSPSSRSFMVNSGPFSMQPGEVQDLIYAYVAASPGSSGDHLTALANLQKMVPTVRKAYLEFLNFQSPVGPRPGPKPPQADSTGVDYFLLAEGHPNPFVQNVKIKFRLLNDLDIHLDIFNSLGQRVKTIYRGHLSKGIHELEWDGTNQAGSILPSGVYFIRLKHGPLMRWKKIIMLK